MSRFRRRSAYYSRNDSFSRSANAEEAESEGRYPRTRAAKALGVSIKAFDAGCEAMGYSTDEWHHVGKYATMVDYWDTERCRESVEFWRGAASAYSSKKKQAELLSVVPNLLSAKKDERLAAFRTKLDRQRDCSIPQPIHPERSHSWHWVVWDACGKSDAATGRYMSNGVIGIVYSAMFVKNEETIPRGDFETLNCFICAAKTTADELDQHSEFKRIREKCAYSVERIERQMESEWLTALSEQIIPIVPENHTGHSFKLLSEVQLLATATKESFTRKMVDARKLAVKMGFNAVIPANPTNHKFGNGWIPALIQ